MEEVPYITKQTAYALAKSAKKNNLVLLLNRNTTSTQIGITYASSPKQSISAEHGIIIDPKQFSSISELSNYIYQQAIAHKDDKQQFLAAVKEQQEIVKNQIKGFENFVKQNPELKDVEKAFKVIAKSFDIVNFHYNSEKVSFLMYSKHTYVGSAEIDKNYVYINNVLSGKEQLKLSDITKYKN